MMQPVWAVLEDVRNLHVLCECRAKDPSRECYGICMRSSLRAMGTGVSVHIGNVNTLAFTHASGSQWHLNLGIPLQSFWASTQR